jgi:hypothetical protein
MFTCLPISTHVMPATIAQDMTTVSKMGLTIAVGLPKLRILRQNPPPELGPPRGNRARDKVTQRVVGSGATQDFIEGTRHPQTLYLSPNQEVSITLKWVGT